MAACRSAASRAATALAGVQSRSRNSYDARRRLRHVLVEDEVGVGLVAEELRALRPQRGDPGEGRLVVGRVAVVAAGRVGGEDLPPQLAILRALEEGPEARRLEREQPLALEAGLLRRLGAAGDHALGQAGQVLLLVDHQPVGVRLLEQVVPELHRQGGELAVDRPQPLLALLRKQRPAAHEVLPGVLEELLLVGVEGEPGPRVPHRLDALEERGVEADVVAVRRHHRRDLSSGSPAARRSSRPR